MKVCSAVGAVEGLRFAFMRDMMEAMSRLPVESCGSASGIPGEVSGLRGRWRRGTYPRLRGCGIRGCVEEHAWRGLGFNQHHLYNVQVSRGPLV